MITIHKKEKFKEQRESVIFNAREFSKGRKMILIAFENRAFSLPKQYPSTLHNWNEDEMDLSHILLDESE